jgi:pimeloyl-ACP methyl ester carboxylesterase
MRDRQDLRFCSGYDGTRLAYATVGTGPPLVKTANWLSHLEYDWSSPIWRHWIEGLSRHHTLYRHDQRGCGLSDRDPGEMSFESWVRDLEAVVDTAKLERFPLLGISQGGAIAVEYAARHPERVSHLVLYGAFARGRLKRRRGPGGDRRGHDDVQALRAGDGARTSGRSARSSRRSSCPARPRSSSTRSMT